VVKGHDVSIFTGQYSHFLKIEFNNKGFVIRENVDGIKYLWMKVLRYGKAHDKRRVFKWFEFAFKILFIPFLDITKPDVIIYSPTAPFGSFSVKFIAKLLKSKLIFEVRDIWPRTLVEIGGISKNNPFIKFMSIFEKFAIKSSDIVVSNLLNYGKHIKELGINKRFECIPNGISIINIEEKNCLNSETLRQIPKQCFTIGYAGTLGQANAMEYFIESMKLLKDFKNIHAVIVGNGKNAELLKKSADGYNQIHFLPLIPKNEIPSLLDKFDVCYIGWRKQPLYNYGVSPNKIYDYMLSAKPILHSISAEVDIVQIAKCGLSVEAEDPEAISKAILDFSNFKKIERENMGLQGRNYVIQNNDYEVLAIKYIEIIK